MPTLLDIANLLGCPAPAGDPIKITGMAALSEATGTELSYAGNDRFARETPNSKAAALIIQHNVKLPAAWTRPVLSVADAELAVAKVLEFFAPPVARPPVGIDSMARIDPTALIGPGAAIGPFAFIGARVRLGARCVIHPGVYIGDDTVLGDDCELYANVVVRDRITIGSRVILHGGAVIGADGFGYRWDGQRHCKIPQIGTVIIGDDVEIGANSCVDRAKFSTTRVGQGTKIDNLVQVGHNVQLGRHCILAGQSGIAGTAKLGNVVIVGGQASVRDHVSVSDGCMIAGTSGVAEDVPPNSIYSGTPALPHRQSLREQKALRRLPDMQVQIKALSDEIEALKKRLDELQGPR